MSDPFVFDHKRLFNEPTMEQHGSHMIIKNVQKPEKTKYLTIDTRFRDQYDTSLLANYNITLPERVNSVKSMKNVRKNIVFEFCSKNCEKQLFSYDFHVFSDPSNSLSKCTTGTSF